MGYVEEASKALAGDYKFIRSLPWSDEARAGYMTAVAMVDPKIRLDHLPVEHVFTIFKQALDNEEVNAPK